MKYKGILMFLTVILIIAILNCSYADRGPTIGANEAKTIAQDYLNSHNFPYTAITPSDYAYKVSDTQTGEVKWISASEAKADNPTLTGLSRYRYISEPNASTSAWIVQVNNQNGKNVEQIYVDAGEGNVFKAIINPEPNDQSRSLSNTGIILAIAVLAIILGLGTGNSVVTDNKSDPFSTF